MTARFVSDILPWLAPPVLGAVVGHLAFFAGVRMLFRPLEEKRVLGLRVPLTPGVLPRERQRLARSIGRFVSRELLNEESIRAQVRSPAVGKQLASAISSTTEAVLSAPVERVAEKGLALLAGPIEDALAGFLQRVFTSRGMIRGVRGLLSDQVAALAAKRSSEVLARFDLKRLVTDRVLPSLADPARRGTVARDLATLLADRAGDVLTDEVMASLASAVEPALPAGAERLAAWLQTEDTRALLSARARELLPRILEKLNVVQRFLLSAGQYDTRLNEKMPEIVDDTVRTMQEIVRDPVQQRKVLALVVDSVRDWRHKLRQEGPRPSPDGARARLAGAAESVVSRALAVLQDPTARERLYDALAGGLLRKNQTLGAFLRESFGLEETGVVDFLAERILTFLASEQTSRRAARALTGLMSDFVRDNGSTTLGALFRIDGERRAGLDSFLTARLVDVVGARLPAVIGGFDVEGAIARRIEALDGRQVEQAVVRALRSRFRWFNPGAAVGLLIGLLLLVMKAFGLA